MDEDEFELSRQNFEEEKVKLLKKIDAELQASKKIRATQLEYLTNYILDMEYWISTGDIDYWNQVTNGTPQFRTLDEAKAYLIKAKKVKELIKNV